MSKQVIYVPKSIPVNYENVKGEKVNVSLYQNRDYKIQLDGGETGSTIYCTVAAIETEKKPNGKSCLILDKILNPGFMNVVVDSNPGADGGRKIPVDDIVDIVPQKVNYVREKRNFKNAQTPDAAGYTFAFDNPKFSSQYRITVYEGEFVAFAVRNKEGNTRSYYGCITKVTDNEIVIDRYISRNGVRMITHKFTIDIENLLGIYRQRLNVSDYVEDEVEEKNVASETPASDSDTEKTE